MRLESALYTSRAGIDSHGKAIGVIGDNVSNVNTVAFKRSRPEFSSLFRGGPEGDIANGPQQTGSGALISDVRQINEEGVIEPTGRAFDAAIDGVGHYIVGTADKQEYTRAGNFEINPDGTLTTTDGTPVLGFVNGATDLTSINVKTAATPAQPTTNVTITANVNSALPAVPAPGDFATFGELSRGASFSSTQEVFDSLGARREVTIALFRGATPNTWTARAYVNGGNVGGTEGKPTQVGADGTLQFDTNGVITDASKPAALLSVAPAWGDGAAPGNFTLDLSGFTQYSGFSTLTAVSTDGRPKSDIEGYKIEKDGTVNAVFAGGESVSVGVIALATFVNDDGLDRAGQNNLNESLTTGARTVGKAGSGPFGNIEGFALERSNVDIATEFVDLTLMQRGYQANSQALTTTSELIKDTIQLMR